MLTHSPYCVFSVCERLYLCGADKYHSLRLEERLCCIILTQSALHTQSVILRKMIRGGLAQFLLCRFYLEIIFSLPLLTVIFCHSSPPFLCHCLALLCTHLDFNAHSFSFVIFYLLAIFPLLSRVINSLKRSGTFSGR